MKASLRSVRIAPKKANLVAKMIRGMSVQDALASLERTNKKAARILGGVIESAAANAKQNDNQNPDDLIIKTLIVNKAITYHRGIPMARGRTRRIRKFLSHIDVTLGYPESEVKEEKSAKAPAKKKTQTSSQKKDSPVKSVKKQSKTSEGSKSKTSKTIDTSKSS